MVVVVFGARREGGAVGAAVHVMLMAGVLGGRQVRRVVVVAMV